MFKFGNPYFLYVLLIIPVLVILFLLSKYLKRKSLKRFGDASLICILMPDVSVARPAVKFFFVLFALASVIFALARPQFGSKLEKVRREGIEIIIALDVSNSMLADDIKPNRLEASKRAKLIEKLKNDKIGLIIFAGDAYVQLPVTTDFGAAKMFLSTINTNYIAKQGTAIGSAIKLAKESFSQEKNKSRALIIISDGENHEDDAMAAAQEASKENIVIHTIGMGLPQGAPIPVSERITSDYKKDNEGNVVITKLNDVALQQIATTANGIYVRASNSTSGLDKVFDEINKMNKELIESKAYSDYDDRFQYLSALALILLLLDFIILERKNRILNKINLFKSSVFDTFQKNNKS